MNNKMYIKSKIFSIEASPQTDVETNFIDRVNSLGFLFTSITTQTAPVTCQVKSEHSTY
jgi:hypothetical protein